MSHQKLGRRQQRFTAQLATEVAVAARPKAAVVAVVATAALASRSSSLSARRTESP